MHDFWALTVSVLNQLLNPIIKGILLCPDVSSYPCSLSKCWGPQKSPTRSNLQAKTTENHQNWCIDTHLSWAAPRISQWNWPSVAWAWPCTAYWLPSLPCLTSTSLPVCPGITFQINYMFWHPCLRGLLLRKPKYDNPHSPSPLLSNPQPPRPSTLSR